MLADTHCHLNFSAFADDRAEVYALAKEAGVVFLLNPGIDLASSQEALQLAHTYPEVVAAVGVHPNEAGVWDANTLSELRRMAQDPKVVAIGEIGLDYYWDRAPRELQKEIFQAQLSLAAEMHLPVVIHTRNAVSEEPQATQDALDFLCAWQAGLAQTAPELEHRPGVLHSYSGNEASARRAVSSHFFLGITGPVTFRNAPDLQRLVSVLPLEHLLLETDAPYLTPHPRRGQRNEPAYVQWIGQKIADLKNLSVDVVAETTTLNSLRLFNWRVSL